MRTLSISLLLVAFQLPATSMFEHRGPVINIADGDTLTILVDKQQFRIRLSDIDTPERK